MNSSARIIFAGSPDFAVPSLQALLRSRHEVIAVLTQPDRPAGRGRKVQPGPVKLAALAAGVTVLQPVTLRDPLVQQSLRDLRPDLLVVVAYGQLLPPEVLHIPRVPCLNVHASLLPRWRGASPIQAAILAGDPETGVSLMQMEAGLDTGPVYCSRRTAIGPTETAGLLQARLAALGGELLAASLDAILASQLQAVPQQTTGVTYAGRIKKAEGIIDWSQGALAIDRRIRAFNPWPVAQTLLDGELLRCWSAIPLDSVGQTSSPPGTVTGTEQRGIVVQTGDGLLILSEVQAPGKKRMSGFEFARSRAWDHAVLGR
jgi:methionyl-tRNA formyltransferase